MIYAITTLNTLDGRRTVGWFKKLEVAKEEVENNSCDIYENGHYPFCVIEEIPEGIYSYGKEYWYQWIGTHEKGAYQVVDKPDELKHVCGFGMG